MIAYIDAHRERFGVEPICRVMQFAPSTYYAAKQRPPSRRAQRDEQLKTQIRRVNRPGFVGGEPTATPDFVARES